MNKQKLLTVLVVGLLISNIALVANLFFRHPGPPHGDGPRNIIIEKLELNKDQVKAYDQLIQWHRSEIGKADEQIKTLKSELYSTLLEDSSITKKDSLIQEIAHVQMNIEQIHYKHFTDIGKLCKPEQQAKYRELTSHIAEYFAGPRPPRR